jgi:hypothetical protein
MIIINISYANWQMFGSNSGEIFLYNQKTGETFRYFDQQGRTGFTKQNFYRNLNLKNSNKNSTNNVQNSTNQNQNSNSNDLKTIQNLLLNNGAGNPMNLLNGIYQ